MRRFNWIEAVAIIEINRDPAASDLKSFGRLLPVFGTLAALVLWWRTGGWTAPAVLAGTAWGVSLVFAAVRPWQRPIYLGWVYATYPIGWTISHIVLAVNGLFHHRGQIGPERHKCAFGRKR